MAGGKGVINTPATARPVTIVMSAIGRQNHDPGWMRMPEMPPLPQNVGVPLAGQNEHQERQRPHLVRTQSHKEPANRENAQAIPELEHAQWDRGEREISNPPVIGVGRRPRMVCRPRHRHKVTGKHRQRLEQRRQDSVTGYDQPGPQYNQGDAFVDQNTQRVGQHALE